MRLVLGQGSGTASRNPSQQYSPADRIFQTPRPLAWRLRPACEAMALWWLFGGVERGGAGDGVTS